MIFSTLHVTSSGQDQEQAGLRAEGERALVLGGGGAAGNAWLIGVIAGLSEIIAAAEDAADMRRRLGAAALEMDAASDGSGQTRWRATVAARLPSQRWPQRSVLIVAVDAHTGEPVVFDRHSGADGHSNWFTPATPL